MRKLELLSPARDLDCGKAAILHGADAVYIGANRFGARAAAGNSVDDIAQLCDYAHVFGAKVYVTVNTILYDDELEATRTLLSQLNEVKVDAVLVQDMAVLSLLPDDCRMAVHASTQTDNRTVEKVEWLSRLGFARVVLARELSVEEITAIHQAVPDVELEAFVHGALCVSYSGLCYASQYCFHRSANRGECAQFCRLAFNLEDADGHTIDHDRHLLSLKDMNRLDGLERLAEAGVTSFKIEGRLKDATYVKNVTAAYSRRIDELIARHPDLYQRASLGRCRYNFMPDLNKTFNRGFTTYFLNGRCPDIASPDTPKAMGEYVGKVKEVKGSSFTVAGISAFANGDGLCFINAGHKLEGFRVNRVEGNRLFPLKMPRGLCRGVALYRNNDVEFERLLSRDSAERKIAITMRLHASDTGFVLTASVRNGFSVNVKLDAQHQQAERPQHDNIVRQLSKLGNTPYECSEVKLEDDFNFFIPSSVLASLRREAVRLLQEEYINRPRRLLALNDALGKNVPVYRGPGYLYNISNELSHLFYERHGLSKLSPAFEKQTVGAGSPLMQCRHCLRYAYGFCVKHGGRKPEWAEPLYLSLPDGRRFRLEFDCAHCQMNVLMC